MAVLFCDALEDLLQRALGLGGDRDAAVDRVRAALDGGDGVLRLLTGWS
jgi:hypothetical protein